MSFGVEQFAPNHFMRMGSAMKILNSGIAKRFILNTNSYWELTFGALVLGVAIACFGLAILPAFEYLIPPEHVGRNAGDEIYKTNSAAGILILIGFVIPLLETVITQTIPIEILRKTNAASWLYVGVSTLVFSLGHYRNGGLMHAAAVTFAGGFFAIIYVCTRSTGVRRAYYVTAVAHCANNIFLYILSMLG